MAAPLPGKPDFISCTDVWHLFPSPSGRGRRGGLTEGDSGVVALQDVSLVVPEGQFVALVGASGCGKTTLLNMLAGLITPVRGTISIAGGAPRCPNLDVGYMFARDALLPWRTARKNVELGLEVRRQPRRQRRQRAMEVLDLVGLSNRHRQFRSQLSQGMRQRVALARTLAPSPRILLMDEPFAALDARTKLDLQAELLRILEASDDSTRRTVIFVTHDLNEAVLLADRVVVMLPSPGRIAMDVLINLPRPRSHMLGELPYTPEFRESSKALFEGLEGALVRTGKVHADH